MYILGGGVLIIVVWLISSLDVKNHRQFVLTNCSLGLAARADSQLDIRLHLFNRMRCVTSLQFEYLPVLS